MQTMRAVDPATATGKAKELLDFVMKRTGRIPNMVRLMVNSPAALNAYLGFAGALRDAKLPAETQELIARSIATRPAIHRWCPGERLLFHRQSGLQIDLRRFN